ncbi:MAG: hotdog fold thioesterase [Deltaproteobacteria bacterium]|nr:hotdog fold thioesterase [Deltaproteobacteria bacterium]
MDEALKRAIFKAVEKEPLARTLGMELVELSEGRSLVRMEYDPASMANIYSRAHGGVLFSLVDGAFETVSQTCGQITVALNVNMTYVKSPDAACTLFAEASLTAETKKTASYSIRVTNRGGELLAFCQALAYRTGKPIPFV